MSRHFMLSDFFPTRRARLLGLKTWKAKKTKEKEENSIKSGIKSFKICLSSRQILKTKFMTTFSNNEDSAFYITFTLETFLFQLSG